MIAEAQASGLPVVAVDEGGPASLIRDRRHRLAVPARGRRRSPRRWPSWRPLRSCGSASGAPPKRPSQGRTWESGDGPARGWLRRVLPASAAGGFDLRPTDAARPVSGRLNETVLVHTRFTPHLGVGLACHWRPIRLEPTEAEAVLSPVEDEARPATAEPEHASRPLGPVALLQPRALLARLQRPGPPARRGPLGPAARAGQVLRDLGVEPGRVLHGPRGQPPGAGRGGRRAPRGRRPQPRRADRRDPRAGRRPSATGSTAASSATCGPRSPSTGSAILTRRGGRPGRARGAPRALPQAGLPGADPAGDRDGPAVSLHLEPLAQPRASCCATPSRTPRSSPGSRCRPSCSAGSCRPAPTSTPWFRWRS